MKKLLAFLLMLCIYDYAYAINIKSFKSKDGYSITYPKNYTVTEKKYLNGHMVILFDKKKADDGKNLMFIMTGPKIFSAEFPYPNQINLGDEICNELQNVYTQQLGKKVNLYVCQKANFLMKGIKTVYDSISEGYKQYQYSFEFNNQTIMISGTCKPKNCIQRDRELSNLTLSIK